MSTKLRQLRALTYHQSLVPSMQMALAQLCVGYPLREAVQFSPSQILRLGICLYSYNMLPIQNLTPQGRQAYSCMSAPIPVDRSGQLVGFGSEGNRSRGGVPNSDVPAVSSAAVMPTYVRCKYRRVSIHFPVPGGKMRKFEPQRSTDLNR